MIRSVFICALVAILVYIIVRTVRDRKRERQNVLALELKFKALFENAIEGIYQSTRDGRLLTANPALVRMFGYESEEEFLKVNVAQDLYMNAGDRETRLACIEREGHLRGVELVLKRRDGARIVVLENSRAARDPNGDLLYFEGTLTDITQVKRDQQREKDRNRVLELIASNGPMEEIFTAIALMLEQQFTGCMPAIDLVQDGRLFNACVLTLPAAFCAAMDGAEVGPNASGCAAAAFREQPIFAADLNQSAAWEQWRELASAHEVRSCWVLPIFSGSGKVSGTIALYSRQAMTPEPDKIEILEQISRLAAIAIDQRRLREDLLFQANHDAVTSLPNRFLFDQKLEEALTAAAASNTYVALFYVDLDGFKGINDTLGHSAGDALLRQVAKRFRDIVRPPDIVARTGGDEFSIFFADLNCVEDVEKLAARLMRAFRIACDLDGADVKVTASIGISIFPDDGTDAASLQRHADQAMYRVKNTGKNGFRHFGQNAHGHSVAITQMSSQEG